jgi:hypothetical protein
MNAMSSDRALTEFLASRNPFTIAKEQPFVPLADVRDRIYDEVTGALLDAIHLDSRARLRVSVEAAFTPVTLRSVRWAR